MATEKFTSIQDFYKFVDGLSDTLRKGGSSEAGQKIYYLVHKVAWTTSTELLGELRNVIKQINKSQLPNSIQNDIDICLNTINHYLKGIEE